MENSLYSISALAYLGDAVWELEVRRFLVTSGICKSAELNKKALSFVTAAAQCDAFEKIESSLTEDELSVYHRGRNHKIESHPKSVSACQYKMATGLEVLFAWLYLEGRTDRIELLFKKAFINENIN